MNDYTDLRNLAESSRIANHDDRGADEAFQEAARPEVVIGLIDEVDALREQLLLAKQAPLYSTRRDAERYRWLKTKLIGVCFDYDDSGKGMLGLSFKLAGEAWVGCNENIDAAMDLKPK